MKNKFLLTNSINKFNNVGVNFLNKDDQFGESNTTIIENIISGIDKRDYYFQTRKINNTYVCIVTKLIISDQTWNKFFGTLLNDFDINLSFSICLLYLSKLSSSLTNIKPIFIRITKTPKIKKVSCQ